MLFPLLQPADERLLRDYLLSVLARTGDEPERRRALCKYLPDSVAQLPAEAWLTERRLRLDRSHAEILEQFFEALQSHPPALLAHLEVLSQSVKDGPTREEFARMRDGLRLALDPLTEAQRLLDAAASADPDVLPDALAAGLWKALGKRESGTFWQAVALLVPHPARTYQESGQEVLRLPLVVALERTAARVGLSGPDRTQYGELVQQAVERLYPPPPKAPEADQTAPGPTAPAFDPITVYVLALGSNTLSTADTRYRLWYTDPQGDRGARDLTGTLKELQAGFSAWISDVLFEWSGDTPLVEFVLPEECLEWDVERWEVALNPRNPATGKPIGTAFPVVLRNWGRYEARPHIKRLERRCKELKGTGTLYWCHEPAHEPGLPVYLDHSDCRTVLYLGAGYPLQRTGGRNLWLAVLRNGVPVVIWRRTAGSGAVPIPDQLEKLLHQAQRLHPFNELPSKIKDWRSLVIQEPPQYDDTADEVSLLWENPYRLPAAPPLPEGAPTAPDEARPAPAPTSTGRID